MKKIMLAIILMTALASITPAADQQLGPIPEDSCDGGSCEITEVPIPPPPVPSCWPVCN